MSSDTHTAFGTENLPLGEARELFALVDKSQHSIVILHEAAGRGFFIGQPM